MKDAFRLSLYFVATILLGAVLAPIFYWSGQSIAAHGFCPFLADVDFERYFHRALLVAAILLIWPLLRSIQVRSVQDVDLAPNPKWKSDLIGGFVIAAAPLLIAGVILIACGVYLAHTPNGIIPFAKIIVTAIFVPVVEEALFRGLILGILLRSGWRLLSIFISATLYSIVHFLKAPEQTSTVVTWASGFNSIAHVFAQFANPVLVIAGFTTLLLIGLILADARIQTRSLWLPIGLHAGWIFASQGFNRTADLQVVMLPWLGRNLLVGIIPLIIGAFTWIIVRFWLVRYGKRNS